MGLLTFVFSKLFVRVRSKLALALLFSLMGVVVKIASPLYGPGELVMYRSLVGLVLLAGTAWWFANRPVEVRTVAARAGESRADPAEAARALAGRPVPGAGRVEGAAPPLHRGLVLAQPGVLGGGAGHGRLQLAARGVEAPVVVGGIIPPADALALRQMGVAGVYTPKDFRITGIMADVVKLVEKANA